MKVVAINGSPNKDGNTSMALQFVGNVLQKNGIDFEIIHVGHQNIRGCIACGKCRENKNEKCVFDTDIVNAAIQKMKHADGLIFGSPVYFSGVAGTMKCFMDRAFYVSGSNDNLFRHKVGATLVAARRAGGSASLDCLNHYLSLAEMIIASSNYWNIIHGQTAGQVEKDEEGVQTLEILGQKMLWLMNMKQQTKDTVVEPIRVPKIRTNFIK